MIKIKILNPGKGRNELTFRPLFFARHILRDFSIELTESNDFDFMFVGMDDFYDQHRTLDESVEWGLENLERLTQGGDYFLVDGQDSTSLFGAYDTFSKSNAIYLLTNCKLFTREEYKTKYFTNKFFFGEGGDVSYDIPKKLWERIKLTGWNVGYWNQNYSKLQPINSNKSIDISALYNVGGQKANYHHGVRNDLFYKKHRQGALDKLKPLISKYNIQMDRRSVQEYYNITHQSKICISPYGMGEIGERDYEAMMLGTIILKPSCVRVDSFPKMMIENETYIPCEYDWSDLEEKIEYTLDNFKELNEKLVTNCRKFYLENFTYESIGLHLYNMFKNLNDVILEEELDV